jgi:lipoate---protein ligase
MWIDDQILENFEDALCMRVFVPEVSAVVLGSGNDVYKEVNVSACQEMHVPILRRYGGGGTVILYPGCVVVSLGLWVKDQFSNPLYFRLINNAVIRSLARQWPSLSGLEQAGISDIVVADKKIAGTSMFRSRNYLLYQASILVNLDSGLIGRVLTHPTKEPAYRKGRQHEDFLMGLCDIAPEITSPQTVVDIFESHLLLHIQDELSEHLIAPVQIQFKALRDRLDRAKVHAVASNLT